MLRMSITIGSKQRSPVVRQSPHGFEHEVSAHLVPYYSNGHASAGSSCFKNGKILMQSYSDVVSSGPFFGRPSR